MSRKDWIGIGIALIIILAVGMANGAESKPKVGELRPSDDKESFMAGCIHGIQALAVQIGLRAHHQHIVIACEGLYMQHLNEPKKRL